MLHGIFKFPKILSKSPASLVRFWRLLAGRPCTGNHAPAARFEEWMEERERPVLSATEARQATRGQGLRYVLAVSVTLAVIAMVVAYFVA